MSYIPGAPVAELGGVWLASGSCSKGKQAAAIATKSTKTSIRVTSQSFV